MDKSFEKYYYSPETGMKLLISEELDERMKEDLFPEKTARAKEILFKIDLSQLKAVGKKNNLPQNIIAFIQQPPQ